MDFLQISLIFLIILLGIFLSITGLQVFFILRDLKKTLDNVNKILTIDRNKGKITSLTKNSTNFFPRRRLFKNIK